METSTERTTQLIPDLILQAIRVAVPDMVIRTLLNTLYKEVLSIFKTPSGILDQAHAWLFFAKDSFPGYQVPVLCGKSQTSLNNLTDGAYSHHGSRLTCSIRPRQCKEITLLDLQPAQHPGCFPVPHARRQRFYRDYR